MTIIRLSESEVLSELQRLFPSATLIRGNYDRKKMPQCLGPRDIDWHQLTEWESKNYENVEEVFVDPPVLPDPSQAVVYYEYSEGGSSVGWNWRGECPQEVYGYGGWFVQIVTPEDLAELNRPYPGPRRQDFNDCYFCRIAGCPKRTMEYKDGL